MGSQISGGDDGVERTNLQVCIHSLVLMGKIPRHIPFPETSRRNVNSSPAKEYYSGSPKTSTAEPQMSKVDFISWSSGRETKEI